MVLRYVSAGLIIIVLYLLFKYKIKKHNINKAGKVGERHALKYVKNMVENTGDIVYNNIEIPLYGDKTEIDILIVTNQGIICIENKHVVGRISGRQTDHYWKQQKSNETKKMYNPIKQNSGHIKCLNYHFNKKGYHDISICGYVIFSNEKTELEKTIPNVGYLEDFRGFYLKNYASKKPLINIEQVRNVIDNIKMN